MSTTGVLITDAGPVRTLSLNRPDKHNALNAALIREVTDAVREAGTTTHLRVLQLQGEGKSFCAGADLGDMANASGMTEPENQAAAETLFDLFDAVASCPLPVVGRIHGRALGGGLGLVAACDISAAESATQFRFSEVRLGLVPAVISPFVLRKVAPHRAREWMLTARAFSSHEAADAGLVNFTGSERELEVYLQETLQALVQAGPQAVRATKTLLNRLPALAGKDLRTETAKVIAAARAGAEGREGVKAFFDKRDPGWRS